MLLNEHTILVSPDLLLVPYSRHHVPQYHEWMKSPELQQATASEPLSLEEEYEMQESWRVDDDKLTFIILHRLPSLPSTSPSFLKLNNVPSQMIGDVNLFLSPSFSSDSDSEDSPANSKTQYEMEIMLASPSSRRAGHALQSLKMLLSFSSSHLPEKPTPDRFFAKIGMANEGSIKLFEKLGFRKAKVVEAFGEVEMRWAGEKEWGWTEEEGGEVQIRDATDFAFE